MIRISKENIGKIEDFITRRSTGWFLSNAFRYL